MARGATPTRTFAAAVAAAIGVVVLALPVAAQTGGGSTTTTTTPTTTPTTGPQHAAGPVGTQSVCTANTAAAFVAAFTTASTPTFGCSDGAGNQVINVTGSFTLTGTQGAYAGTQPLIVNGAGNAIQSNGSSRIFTSSAPLTTINNLTLTNGSDGGGRGGAVRTNALVVNGSTFSGNHATNGGGAVDVENGNVTITNSTFTNNSATGDKGGALRVHGSASAITAISGSTFNGNSDSIEAGAIYSDGIVELVNSTVTQNSVAGGGNGGAISAEQVTVAYSDVTANTSGGGQIFLRSIGSPRVPGVFEAFGSLVGSFPGGTPACSYQRAPNATSISFGYNYLSDTTCFPGPSPAPVPLATDLVTTTAPQIGALASNGGPTLTLLPAATSPLVDKIPLAACQTPPLATGVTTDQRGFTRPVGAGCDIGAVEVQAATAIVVVPRFTG